MTRLLLTPEEAAEVLGIGRTKVYELILSERPGEREDRNRPPHPCGSPHRLRRHPAGPECIARGTRAAHARSRGVQPASPSGMGHEDVARPRPSGEGSIYRRHDHPSCPPAGPDGQRPEHRCRGRWTATIELPSVAGRRRRATFFGTSHADVKQKLNDARQRLEAGAPAKDARSRLADVVEDWIATSLAASDRKASTKTTYTILLRTHVLPDDLAAMQIGRIKTSDIESLIVRLRAKNLSPSTVRQIYTVLRQVFDTAVRDKCCERTPPRSCADPP